MSAPVRAVSMAACVLVCAVARGQSVAESDSAAGREGEEGAASVEAAAPRVELTVLGPNPSYVGQLVELELALLRDQRASDEAAPFFGEPTVPGAISRLSTNSPPPEVRRQDGISWLVQKRRYLVFPQTDGRLRVAPIEVGVSTAGGDLTVLRSRPVELRADVPKGAGARVPLVARDVRIERSIDGDLDHLRVGDTFTVRLHVQAEQTDAVMLPVLQLPQLEGLSRYPGEPHTLNRAERGQYHAERVDSATYVADTWGRYTLPRTSVFWLDPQTGEYHEAVEPARAFRARVNPSLGAGCVGGPGALARGAAWIFAFVAGVLLVRRLVARLRRERDRRARVRRSPGERAAFAALEREARSGRDPATLTALYRWLRFAVPGLPTLARLRRADDDGTLHAAIDALESRVSGASAAGRAEDVLAPLRRFRRSTRRATDVDVLPELNASGASPSAPVRDDLER